MIVLKQVFFGQIAILWEGSDIPSNTADLNKAEINLIWFANIQIRS